MMGGNRVITGTMIGLHYAVVFYDMEESLDSNQKVLEGKNHVHITVLVIFIVQYYTIGINTSIIFHCLFL